MTHVHFHYFLGTLLLPWKDVCAALQYTCCGWQIASLFHSTIHASNTNWHLKRALKIEASQDIILGKNFVLFLMIVLWAPFSFPLVTYRMAVDTSISPWLTARIFSGDFSLQFNDHSQVTLGDLASHT